MRYAVGGAPHPACTLRDSERRAATTKKEEPVLARFSLTPTAPLGRGPALSPGQVRLLLAPEDARAASAIWLRARLLAISWREALVADAVLPHAAPSG